MGDRFLKKQLVAAVLIAAVLVMVRASEPGQPPPGRQRPSLAKGEAGLPREAGEARRLARELARLRLAGDKAGAARVFARLFDFDPAGDPVTSLKTAAAAQSGRLIGAAAADKDVPAGTNADPVFATADPETRPTADVRRSGDGTGAVFTAAERWSGNRPGNICVRKSAAGGVTWDGTVVFGGGLPRTQPSLVLLADDTVGVAYVEDWSDRDGDIRFLRLSADLAEDEEIPVALSLADERAPSLATDRGSYPDAYGYLVYAQERDGVRSIMFRVSPDLGSSWSRATAIDAFAAPAEAAGTALAYDPGRNALHVAYARPWTGSSGIVVSTSRDFGASWSRPVSVTPAGAGSCDRPRIAARDGEVVVVFERGTGSGRDIGLARSPDSGRSWIKGESLAATAAAEGAPDVRAAGVSPTAGFFASYLEGDGRVVILRSEAAGPSSWTTAAVIERERVDAAAGPTALVAMDGPEGAGAVGAFWTDGSGDPDIYFGSAVVPLSLAALDVTPANQDVPASPAGTTSFAVVKTGEGSVAWNAAVIVGGDWLSIISGSSGNNNGTVVAAYRENTGSLARIGSIQVSSPDISVPPVTVTVTQAGRPALTVTPAYGLVSSGPEGGPFTPESQAYTLENTGGTAIDWTASTTQTWTALSATAGTLAPGETAVVTVSIDAAGSDLAAGTYVDTVSFVNTTDGTGSTTRSVTLTVSATAGALAVTPAGGLASSGPAGGPFTPVSLAYTLENTGGTAIDWTAAKTQTWTALSATAGTLAPGETATVTVSIAAVANTLAPGDYADTVSFVNTTGGAGSTTRPVSLAVSAGPILAVSPSGRDVPYSAGTATFEVSNAGGGSLTWTAAVVAGGSWLSIASGSGGTGDGTISVAFTVNQLSSERVGIIRVTAAGAAGSPRDVTVTQAPGAFGLALDAARLYESAWLIRRQYARLSVTVINPAAIPIARYEILRRTGTGSFEVLREIAASAVDPSSWIYNDAFVEPGSSYTYRIVAYDTLGAVVSVSNDAAI